MNIGKLDRYVNIIQGTFSQNGYGENIRSTSTLASVWARFEFQRGDAGFEADTFIGTAKARVTIRYRSDLQISPKHYISYNSKEWFIRSIQEIGKGCWIIVRSRRKNNGLNYGFKSICRNKSR